MAGMVRKAGGIMDKWRDYFRTSERDVFDIIEGGIMVAAANHPKDFRVRRDRIAQLLFSAKLSQCVACDRLELFVNNNDEEETGDYADDDDDHHHHDHVVVDDDEEGEFNNKESKLEEGGVGDEKQQSNYSYGDAEALTDEIERESQMVGEVLRIKGILENSEDEPDMLLVDSLRRLELMALSVEILKATEIGKAVNVLRKHASKDIRQLARKLIEGWKVMVDEWVTATATMTGTLEGGTPESMNPSTLDEEEGLPSPPLDDLAFFATQPTSMEFSQFFDGIDDDENFGNITELNKTSEIGRKPQLERPNIVKHRQRLPIESMTPPKDKKDEQTRKQESSSRKQATLLKPNKPSIVESGPGRPAKPSCKVGNDRKLQQKSEKATLQRPLVSQQNKLRCSNEEEKLEASKRKIQERYKEHDNVKRQRTIQVVEIRDLPKQAPPGHKKFHARPRNNHNRNWANVRR